MNNPDSTETMAIFETPHELDDVGFHENIFIFLALVSSNKVASPKVARR